MAAEPDTLIETAPPPPKLRSYDPILDKGFAWTKPLKHIPIIGPNIPNLLSASRALGWWMSMHLFLTIVAGKSTTNWELALGALALTDAFDGYTARKMGLVSDFGAGLDAFFDKVYALSLFYYWEKLARASHPGNWKLVLGILTLVSIQEAFLVAAAIYGYIKKYKVKSNNWGKVKFNVQIVAMAWGFLTMQHQYSHPGSSADRSVAITGILLFVAFIAGFGSLVKHWNSRQPVGIPTLQAA